MYNWNTQIIISPPKTIKNTLIFAVIIAIAGCPFRSEYEKMLKSELKSGMRCDSLFLKFKLGMKEKDFLTHCWEYNQQGILYQGSMDGQRAVLYKIDELRYPATMNFFPKYYNDKISNMEAVIKYVGWSPWNKSRHADSLQLDVVNLFEKWYGKGFIEVHSADKGKAYVKVDGNRRISVFTTNDMLVRVFFTDMMAHNK